MKRINTKLFANMIATENGTSSGTARSKGSYLKSMLEFGSFVILLEEFCVVFSMMRQLCLFPPLGFFVHHLNSPLAITTKDYSYGWEMFVLLQLSLLKASFVLFD